jgi:hypothetical protein
MSRTFLIAFWTVAAAYGARQEVRTFREEMRDPAKVWLFLIGLVSSLPSASRDEVYLGPC